MLNSFKDLEEFAAKAKLTDSLITASQYLADDKYSLDVENFGKAFKARLSEAPTWITNNFENIVKLFSDKGAYGSIFALVKFYINNYEMAEDRILRIIGTDENTGVPVLQKTELNFLLLAAMFNDKMRLARRLLKIKDTEINYQSPKYNLSVLGYGVMFASHETLQNILEYGIKHQLLDLSVTNKNGADILFCAANALQFSTRLATKAHKLDEILSMISGGATCIRGQHNAAQEALRVAPEHAQIFLGYGAGLVKPEYREAHNGKDYSAIAKICPGFDYEQICNADAVLVANDLTTGKPIWLYGIENIARALKDENIEVNKKLICQQLAMLSDLSILSEGVLKLFLPMPTLVAKQMSYNTANVSLDAENASWLKPSCSLM